MTPGPSNVEAAPETTSGTTPDSRMAARSSGALALLVAGLLLAIAIYSPPDDRTANAGLNLAIFLLAVIGVIMVQTRRTTYGAVLLADGAALAVSIALAAVSGGADSPFLSLLAFPVVHAAVFLAWVPVLSLAVLSAGSLIVFVVSMGVEQEAITHPLVALPALFAGCLVQLAAQALREERRRSEEREFEARRLAESDELTGLGNYRLFQQALRAEVARALRYGHGFSLLIFDLDGFKAINDDLGHQAGDEALRSVAAALRGGLRTEDLLCRQGGDEFAVIAVAAAPKEAADLAERLSDAVSRVSVGAGVGNRHQLTISAGIATFGDDGQTAEDLIEHAERQLRDAKWLPRGTAVPPGEERPRRPDATASAPAPGTRSAELVRGRSFMRLTMLSSLSRALTTARTEKAVLETAVAHLAGAVDGTIAAIVRVQHPGGRLEVGAIGGPASTGAPGAPIEAPALHSAVRLGQTAVSNDLPTSDTQPTGTTTSSVRSQLAAPVVTSDGIWGALVVESEKSYAFGEAEREIAGAMAAQVQRALGFVMALRRLSAADWGELYQHAPSVTGTNGLCRWRVAELGWRVGRKLHLNEADHRRAYFGALMHDIGTIGVPAAVLNKPGRLSDEELVVLREHPIIGERLLRGVPRLAEAATTVRHEHERFDGAGYPDGLAGREIPLASRVVMPCGAYVAMSQPRPYRPPLSRDWALGELRRGAGGQFDPSVADALLEVLHEQNGSHPFRGDPAADGTDTQADDIASAAR